MPSAERSARAAAELLALARSRPPTLGSGRLICLDGPAGAGKTTIASELARQSGTSVVHLDDLYDGWRGLPHIGATLDTLLRPMAACEPGRYRRYDWPLAAFAETVEVAPVAMLVVEGVGSGALQIADLVTVLAWVDAPAQVRRARAMARDGDAFAPHWEQWAADESVLFASDRARERADVRLNF